MEQEYCEQCGAPLMIMEVHAGVENGVPALVQQVGCLRAGCPQKGRTVRQIRHNLKTGMQIKEGSANG